MEDCSICIANEPEILQSCIKPSKYPCCGRAYLIVVVIQLCFSSIDSFEYENLPNFYQFATYFGYFHYRFRVFNTASNFSSSNGNFVSQAMQILEITNPVIHFALIHELFDYRKFHEHHVSTSLLFARDKRFCHDRDCNVCCWIYSTIHTKNKSDRDA